MHFSQYGEKMLVNAWAGSKYNSNRDKNKRRRVIYLCCTTCEALARCFANLAEGKINLTRKLLHA